MGFQESCTPNEWQTLQFAPLWTFTAVAGVDKKVDQKEIRALAKELAEGSLFKDPLTREVMVSVGSNLATVMTAYHADSRDLTKGLEDVADILDLKAPANAQAFKRAMLLVGLNIAKASGGGIFGLGDPVGQDEKLALAVVCTALRLDISSM